MRHQILFWLGAATVFFLLVWVLKGVLLPFVIGLAVAYFLDPLVDRLEKAGAGRTLATSFVLFSFAAVFVVAIALTLPVLQEQMLRFAGALPGYVEKARAIMMPWIEKAHVHLMLNKVDVAKQASGYATQAFNVVTDALGRLWNGGLAVFDILSILIVAPVVSFYLLRDWDVIVAKIDNWIPRAQAKIVRRLVGDMDAAVSGFIRGQAIVCLVLGVFYGTALTLFGLDFGFLIGFMAGVLSFIPYVGSIVGLVTGILVAYFQFDGDLGRMLVVVGIFGAGQLVEGNVLTPKLVGDKVGLHAVWILFALMAGGSLLGFLGVMIAVPAAAVIGVLVRFFIAEYMKSTYYTGSRSVKTRKSQDA